MIRCTLLQLYDIRSHFLLPLLTTHEVKIKTLKCILSVFVSVTRMYVKMFELRGEDIHRSKERVLKEHLKLILFVNSIAYKIGILCSESHLLPITCSVYCFHAFFLFAVHFACNKKPNALK